MPKISVISPAYNHGKYVAQAVQSVISQTIKDWEYIISDDASSDNTVEQIKSFVDPRILLITNTENVGSSLNSARCWQRASGKYIAWLTTDDIFEATALEVLSSYLDSHPDTLAVFGLCRFINEAGEFTGEQWKADGVGLNRFQLLNAVFYHKHVLCPPALMVRRELLEKIGYYPANLRQINDTAVFIKLLFAGETAVLPDLVLRFRQRDNNLNVSSPTSVNLNRFAFEMTEVIELFGENIQSFDILAKIFPQAIREDWPPEDRFIPYYLAQLALGFHHPSYWLYALRLLHRVFASPELAAQVKAQFGFGYREYFELTGKTKVIFDLELANYKEHYQRLVTQQEETINQLNSELEKHRNHCSKPEEQLPPSITKILLPLLPPLRKIRHSARTLRNKFLT